MSQPAKRSYEFGPFVLDAAEQQLLRDGREVRVRVKGRETSLPPRAFGVLHLLVRNGGRLLTKDDFLREVWGGASVEEKAVADSISLVRQALGEGPQESRYVKTESRRGYRFVADVRAIEEGGGGLLVRETERARIVIEEEDEPAALPVAGPAEHAGPATALRPAPGPVSRRVYALTALAVGGLAVALLAAYHLGRGRALPPDSGAAVGSLAVLPFKPLVAGARDESLELGMADTLITRLSAVGRLAVRPTSAVRRYTSLEDEAVSAGRELGVDAVLDGSIQKAGDRVRVSVRLVRVGQGETLWAEQFDEKFTDIFSVQDSIARRVVGALALRLSGEEGERLTKRYTENTEAYRLYLTGRYFWNKRTAEGFEKALDYYRQAIAADPNYALAHAGLAETYIILPNWTAADPAESFTLAEREARRALELDPGLPQAYTALASVKIYRDRDWAGAGEDYRRAIGLNPNYATARQWHSEWLMMTGRLGEAIAEAEAAQRLDPLSPIITFEYAVMLYFGRRHDEAAAQLRRVLELEPGLYRARVFLSRIHFDRGQYEGAIRERALTLARGDEAEARRVEAELLTAYRAGGPEGYLRRTLELRNGPGVSPEHRLGIWAESCARLGDRECTFEALREAERARHPIVDSLKVDPYFDFLRSDPRYAELLRKIGPE